MFVDSKDLRRVVEARAACHDVRDHLTRAATAARYARTGPFEDALNAVEAVEAALAATWESVAYLDGLLALVVDEG